MLLVLFHSALIRLALEAHVTENTCCDKLNTFTGIVFIKKCSRLNRTSASSERADISVGGPDVTATV